MGIKDELTRYRTKEGMFFSQDCTAEENAEFANVAKYPILPDGVFEYKGYNNQSTCRFYKVYDAGLSDSEINEYLQYRQMHLLDIHKEQLKSINSKLTFFFVIALVGLILGLLGIVATSCTAALSPW